MNNYGLIIANDGQAINQGRNKMDSNRRTLILDLEGKPPHMDIVPHGGGTAYTDPLAPFPAVPVFGRIGRDVLFEMSHNLGFAPLIDAYFYVTSFDGLTTASQVGGYGNDVYYLSGSAGTLADVVTWEATTTDFRLVHYFDAYGSATGVTSDAPKYKFRTKFYIYSIDSGRTTNYGYPYDGEGNVIQQ